MNRRMFAMVIVLAGALLSGCAHTAGHDGNGSRVGMELHYLEYVTAEADALVRGFEATHGVTFSDPIPELGNSRTTELAGGWKIGIRAPMHPAEEATVRPYFMVDDIEAAVAAAVEGGGELAMPPTEAPGVGRFAIYFQGGTQHGLWQRPE